MGRYTPPTDSEVLEVVRRITTPQLRRSFFEGLENPLWVSPLAEAGFFAAPPEPQMTPEGLSVDVYWPEMQYLIRVAAEVPHEVVNVLLPLASSTNAWLRRGVINLSGIVPVDEAARLEPLLRAWAATGFGARTDPRDLVRLAVRLIQGGEERLGRWFANVIFRPTPSGTREHPTDALGGYAYVQGLPSLISALNHSGLALVWPWLELYERQCGRLTATVDLTYFGRDSIRIGGESEDSVEQVLINGVRDLAISAMTINPARALNVLSRPPTLLGRKIALFALSEAIRREGETSEATEAVLGAAQVLLEDQLSLEEPCRIDYAELVRALASVAPHMLERLPQVFATALNIHQERVRGRIGSDQDNSLDIEERVADFSAHWLHRWLSAVGADALPDPMRHELKTLDERFGVVVAPLQPIPRITNWLGRSSPLTVEAMSVMSPHELVAHLETWHHPTSIHEFANLTHEGQGRELATLLTSNPKAILAAPDLADRLRPTYLRAILRGWEAAVKAGVELDWDAAAEVVRGVVSHDYESAISPEGNEFEDDANLGPAKDAAIGLLETLIEYADARKIPETALARYAELLLMPGEDEKAWSDYNSQGRDDHVDPLTLSLNCQWPIRLRALIHLMAQGRDTPWYKRARSALEREVARPDTRGASRAVLGEELAALLTVDPDWAAEKLPEWFGSAASTTADQQIALTTAMAVHRYHPLLYAALSGPMLSTLAADEPLAVGWRNSNSGPVQRIGEWVIEAFVRGDRELEDPVGAAFFSSAPASEIGKAMSHISWTFIHADHVDEDVSERFRRLWDERFAYVRDHMGDVAQLSGFAWVVKSQKFDVDWWLPRLREAVTLNPDLKSERYMIGEELGAAAQIDPRVAFEVLVLLLEADGGSGLTALDITPNALPIVLARAIDSGDNALRAEALNYMNHLGEQGHVRLEDQVNALRGAPLG